MSPPTAIPGPRSRSILPLKCGVILGTLLETTVCTAATRLPIGEDEQTPNVVIIYLDDIGTEFFGLYDLVNAYDPGIDPFTNGIYVQTPVLDSLAARGVVFTSAYSSPVCSPGRASLLTGCSQQMTGLGTLIRHQFVGGLAEFGDPGFERSTLADLVHHLGGEAGVIGKWHLSLPTELMDPLNGNPKFGGWEGIAARGHWDDVRCTFGNLNSPQLSNGQPGGYYNFEWYENGTLSLQTGSYATSLQMSEALDFCQNAREPFIAYVAPNAVHYPLSDLPPAHLVNTPAYIQGPQSKVKDCQAALEALDSELGLFLNGLDAERRARTMIVVMGDNGTDLPVMRSALIDYGPLGQTYNTVINSAYPRFKHSLFEGGIRVPLVVSWAGIEQPGRSSNALVFVSDIYPTLAEMWSMPPGDIDGKSFLPVLENPAVSANDHSRQDLRIDFFSTNGSSEEARNHREIAYTRRLSDGRRFKLLRRFALPEHSSVMDRFFLLQDSSGAWVDPYELAGLDIAPGSAYHAEYLECALALAPECLENFCSSQANSTGLPALMSAVGPASVSANALALETSPVPAEVLGFFRYSSRAASIPLGNGTLCLGSDEFGPFDLPFNISTQGGVLRHTLDVGAPPSPQAAVCAGATWRYQGFFRESDGQQAEFGLSDGLVVRWAP
jgi:arylsulfatase A-like enzyme